MRARPRRPPTCTPTTARRCSPCSTRSTAGTTLITDMSPYVTQAIVASEDTRFYEHNGVDAKGIARAFVANQQAGGVSQGASTLTMQYVRMALRDGAQTPQEVARGHRADHRPQAAGDAAGDRAGEAASPRRRSWSATSTRRTSGTGRTASSPPPRSSSPRRPSDLTLAEAATLAGLVKAPSAYDPASRTARRPPNGATTSSTRWSRWARSPRTRRRRPPRRTDQAEAHRPAERLRLGPRGRTTTGASSATTSATGGCEQPAFGSERRGNARTNLRRGGYKIVTTLDPKIQALAR